MRNLLIVLGVPVDQLTLEGALERIDAFVASGRATGKSHQIATVNTDFVVNALHDPDLRHILRTADMTTADGAPVVWAARLLGLPLEDRVAGADLVPSLATHAAERGYSLYLLGGGPGVAAQAARILVARNPGLRIAGVASPPYSSVAEVEPAILEDIRRAQPDILLVALGNPKQEKWVDMYADDLGVPVCIGVGGTLDMIAGVTRRAPRWSHRIGLEWLFRLAQEPRRLWQRYVRDGLYFSWFFLLQWWQLRRLSLMAAPIPAQVRIVAERQPVVQVSGRIDVTSLADLRTHVAIAQSGAPRLIIDLSEATFLDSAALGVLVDLTRQARERGGDLVLCGLAQPIAEVIGLLKLDSFFTIVDDLASAMQATAEPAPAPADGPYEANRWTVARMIRELDAYTIQPVLDACLAIIDRNPRLVLDFGETRFLSSAGMAALVKLQRAARLRGGDLRLAGCTHDVRLAIELVRLDAVIAIFPDVQAATADAPDAPAALPLRQSVPSTL